MKPTARPRDAHKLAHYAIGVRNGVKDVSADRQIEGVGGGVQAKHRLVLEPEARAEPRVSSPRELEVRVDDVYTEQAGVGKQLCEARGDLARAASGVENPEPGPDRLYPSERHFLRPDRPRASRLRTIDSSAISRACGLRSVMWRCRHKIYFFAPSEISRRRPFDAGGAGMLISSTPVAEPRLGLVADSALRQRDHAVEAAVAPLAAVIPFALLLVLAFALTLNGDGVLADLHGNLVLLQPGIGLDRQLIIFWDTSWGPAESAALAPERRTTAARRPKSSNMRSISSAMRCSTLNRLSAQPCRRMSPVRASCLGVIALLLPCWYLPLPSFHSEHRARVIPSASTNANGARGSTQDTTLLRRRDGREAAENCEVDQLAGIWFDGWNEAHAHLVPAELKRVRTSSFLAAACRPTADVRVVGPPGAPVGFAIIKDDELYRLAVSAPSRGSGAAAAALIDDAEARLAAGGVRTAWAGVRDRQSPGCALLRETRLAPNREHRLSRRDAERTLHIGGLALRETPHPRSR